MALLQARRSSRGYERLPPDQRTDRRSKLNNPHVWKSVPASVHDSVERYLSYLRHTPYHLTSKDLRYELGLVGPHDLQRPRRYAPYTLSWPTDTCRTLSDRHRSVEYHGRGLVRAQWPMIRPTEALRLPFARLLGINRDSSEKPTSPLESEPRHRTHNRCDINQSSR